MTTKQLSIPLGNETIYLDTSIWGDSKIVFINVHENEQTSVAAGQEILSNTGGILIELKSKGDRLISFASNGIQYTFDPNRIFSAAGIKASLLEFGPYDPEIEKQIATLAATIIETILSYHPTIIIALHNTTGDYSMNNYIPGGKLENDKSDIFINPQMNNADLFFTTDKEAFDLIKNGGFNVVLQNNENVTEDGSLSVYCSANGLRYINIEALHGHKNEQMQMITFINNALAQTFG